MPRKLTFDGSISKDIMAASADSFADSIKMIDIDAIVENKENFYELSEIEMLADDIERQGLKHNLVVEEHESHYIIKSGHRRFAAIKLLFENGRLNSRKIPCYVDSAKTKAEAKLDLIMLNATQRKYTDAEVLQEYDELKMTFLDLAKEGKELKGRMRERIATALRVSPAQVGKIENIKNNAIDEVTTAIGTGQLSISAANEIVSLEPEAQKELIYSAHQNEKISHKEIKEFKQRRDKEQQLPDENTSFSEADETQTVKNRKAERVEQAQVGKIENIKGQLSISAANEIVSLEPEAQKELIYSAHQNEKISHKEIKEFKQRRDKEQQLPDENTSFSEADETQTVKNRKAERVEQLIEYFEENPLWEVYNDGGEILFESDEINNLVIAALQCYKISIRNKN